MLAFPRMKQDLDHIPRQHQVIVGDGHDMAPALTLSRSPQTGLGPHHCLFAKAIALFLDDRYVAHSPQQWSIGPLSPEKCLR